MVENFKKNFVFFGTDDFSIGVLEELAASEIIPDLIVTAPDRHSGRGQHLQSPPVKIWADNKNIPVLQPEKLDENFIEKLKSGANKSQANWLFFVVASYGKIIPQSVLDIPVKGALNVHPSLLPLYRGASPIETAILNDEKETGVTIMLMDDKMDHGPILDQTLVDFEVDGEYVKWPTKIEVEKKMAAAGGQILAEVIESQMNNDKDDNIFQQEQDHSLATFTKKITKEEGLIDVSKLESRETFLKVQALNPWPGAYFFIEHAGQQIRVKITAAEFINNKTKITKVIPEGKKEMTFEDFKRGFNFLA